MDGPLSVKGSVVSGEIALEIKPGTTAKEQNDALDGVLSGPLSDAASGLDSVLAAAPHRFARPLPGKDAEGRTRFVVRGHAEGGRLVPERVR